MYYLDCQYNQWFFVFRFLDWESYLWALNFNNLLGMRIYKRFIVTIRHLVNILWPFFNYLDLPWKRLSKWILKHNLGVCASLISSDIQEQFVKNLIHIYFLLRCAITIPYHMTCNHVSLLYRFRRAKPQVFVRYLFFLPNPSLTAWHFE